MVDDFLSWVDGVPHVLVYLGLGAGAAVENLVPAVPADTFVVIGGFLSALGDLEARWVFTATWLFNVGSALVTYRLGYTLGRPSFESGMGRRLLNAHQLDRMTRFYARWGIFAIFFTRFLPGLRAVVPVFAGVSHVGFVPVAVPLAAASAIWYGALVWLGAVAGSNLPLVRSRLSGVNRGLLAVAVVVTAAALLWWWRTRRPSVEE